MSDSMQVLMLTALTLAVTHTAIGPDHYLPFIVLGRSEGWSYRKTALWTFLCGMGHVLSSVVIGGIGVAVGWAVSSMEWFEGIRGEAASWGLMVFGGGYMLWGIYLAIRGRGHSHPHVHADGTEHDHPHLHKGQVPEEGEHRGSPHEGSGHGKQHRRTLWTVFIIFVLGPCEPLIPILMVPASKHSFWGIALVAAIFSVATIATMLLFVTLGHFGLRFVKLGFLEKYVHAFSGGAILVSGLAIKALGI